MVEKEIKEEEVDERSKKTKRIDNLFTKLRLDEKSIKFARGDDVNKKNYQKT